MVPALALLAGCAAPQPDSECTFSFQEPSRWTFPGTHYPPSSIDFLPGGKVNFVGGFANYENPTWYYDSANGELAVTLPNASERDISTIRTNHVPRGFVHRIDVESKTLFWKVDSCTDHFFFQLQRYEIEAS